MMSIPSSGNGIELPSFVLPIVVSLILFIVLTVSYIIFFNKFKGNIIRKQHKKSQ